MKNNYCDSVKYILAKNVRSSGNSIIYSWISMLLAGIYAVTADTAALGLLLLRGDMDYVINPVEGAAA